MILLTGGVPGLVPGGAPGQVWGVYLVWSWGGVPGLVQWGVPGTPPRPGTPSDQVPPRPGTPPGTRYPDQVPPWTRYPPGPGTPPRTRYTPQDQIHPPGPGTPPGNKDNEWPVCILLECILVFVMFLHVKFFSKS